MNKRLCDLILHADEDLQSELARAISDPGSIVGRQHHLDESVPRWSTRAVLHVLAAHLDQPMEDVDRAWLYELVLHKFHDEFCEYDGKEDGQDVCAGECREIAELASGMTAVQIASMP